MSLCIVVALNRRLKAAQPVGAATLTKEAGRPAACRRRLISCNDVWVVLVLPVPGPPSMKRRKGGT